jgi:hypothetical protein
MSLNRTAGALSTVAGSRGGLVMDVPSALQRIGMAAPGFVGSRVAQLVECVEDVGGFPGDDPS